VNGIKPEQFKGSPKGSRSPIFPWVIGLVSVLPFWLGAYGVYWPFEGFSPVSVLSLTSIYGGVYLSLVGGSKWGLVSAATNATQSKPVWPAAQMLMAFMIMLAGFCAIILPAQLGLTILLAGFMFMALWDLIHSQAGVIVFWYARLRVWLTVFTVAPLLALLLKVL